MLTISGNLEKIKKFLEDKMEENHITLPQAPPPGQQGQELIQVQPIVVVGNLPHANFTTYGMDARYFQAPYITIGVDDCTWNYDDEYIPVLIQVCCYSVLPYEDSSDPAMQDLKIPDNMGTLDVYNLLENIREWTIKDAPFIVERPIKIGSYDTKEATYPFSFGYISFAISSTQGKAHKVTFD